MYIVIADRFRGPPEIGNEGYVCGMLAQRLDGPAQVRLLAPPPLEKALSVVELGDGGLALRDGASLIAEARPASLELVPPTPPSFEEAEAATRSYVGHAGNHPFPTCFVCGPLRETGDGLRILSGVVPGRGLVASPWVPDHSLADDTGNTAPEFVWAALDCPGFAAAVGDAPRPALLGQMTAALDRGVTPGQRCIVVGWRLGQDGRKHFMGTALFNEAGEVCGRASAIWIEPKAA